MKKENGQTMLLTVILLSGAILFSVSFTSLLMIFQIRQSVGIKDSTKSIYAADSGIECILFNKYRTTAPSRNCGDVSPIELDNGAKFRTIDVNGDGSVFKSIGQFNNSARAFEISF